MKYNPTVSQFTLSQEQQHLPPNLSNLQHIEVRSRNRYQRTEKIYHPHHHISTRPQQVIIDASLNKPLNTSIEEKEEQGAQGIRKHIDACLNAIETAYTQNKRKKAASMQQNQPIIDNRTIHRIDTNLVLEYTRAICKDYKLRDRFANDETQINIPLSHQKQSQTLSPTNRQRTQSVGPMERSRRQYLNITQNSKLERKGFSTQKKRIQQPTSPRSHQRSHSIHQSPQVTSHPVKLGQSTNLRAINTPKIQEDFRYCINCEASILSRNVDYHQKYECKNFSSLYQLSFSQLTAMMGQKVAIINKQLKKKLQKLKEKDLSKSRAENICNQTLDRIEDYLNESSVNSSFDKNNHQYQKFKDSLNNQYGQVVKLTHKLHWFNQVYLNLKNESQKRRDSSRVMQLSRFTPTILPPYQQARMVAPSAISQLHPHLHRQSFNPPRTFNQST